MGLLSTACSNDKDEEIERLKAENEALRASVSQQTEATTELYIEPIITTTIETTTAVTTVQELSTEDIVNTLTESLSTYLSSFYEDVKVEYDSETDYFIITANVKNADRYLSTTYSWEWEDFVDNTTEKYGAIRDTIVAKDLKSKLKLSLYSDSDNSEMITIKGNTITYNALKDLYAGKVPTNKDSSTKSSKSNSPTKGQENALKTAKSYLDFMPFSYEGLIEQLEFEKYTHSEAVYAADNCGADWNEQAAEKAEDYLEIMSFSREGLIDQLKFEGFTQSQAEYAVSAVY